VFTGETGLTPGSGVFEAGRCSHTLSSAVCCSCRHLHGPYWILEIWAKAPPHCVEPALDLPKIFGIHLLLACLGCLRFRRPST